MAADNPYKSKRQTGYGWTRPSNTGEGPYTPEHPSVVPITPPVKTAQLPNALEVCDKLSARNLALLDQKARIEGTTAARKERDRFAELLKESCEERARKKGYFDPINDIRDFLFGGDNQASNFKQPDSPDGWSEKFPANQRPTPDGKP